MSRICNRERIKHQPRLRQALWCISNALHQRKQERKAKERGHTSTLLSTVLYETRITQRMTDCDDLKSQIQVFIHPQIPNSEQEADNL